MKPSEYGGADTHKTHGIQPDPHTPSPAERLRLMYASDESDPEPLVVPGLKEG